MLLRMQTPAGGLDDDGFPEVLAAARAGEAWAAEAIFRDLQPRVLRFLRSAEPRAADDVAGELWLAVAKGLGGFQGELADLRAWVFSIARRRLADHRRTSARRNTEPTDDGVFVGRPDPADVAGVVVQRLSGHEAAALVAALLPADQAEVVLLRVLGDLDVSRVAEVMGRSANWVRVVQHRALRRLAERLSDAPVESLPEIPQIGVIPATSPTICPT